MSVCVWHLSGCEVPVAQYPSWDDGLVPLVACRAVVQTRVVAQSCLGRLLVEGTVAACTTEVLLSQPLFWTDMNHVATLLLPGEVTSRSQKFTTTRSCEVT